MLRSIRPLLSPRSLTPQPDLPERPGHSNPPPQSAHLRVHAALLPPTRGPTPMGCSGWRATHLPICCLGEDDEVILPERHERPRMIELRNVTKYYGEFRALDGCTAIVPKGSVVVVCGPSGSGKSTLIRCVNGLEPIDDGVILVDGMSVTAPETDLPRLRARIGMVFQSFELFPH